MTGSIIAAEFLFLAEAGGAEFGTAAAFDAMAAAEAAAAATTAAETLSTIEAGNALSPFASQALGAYGGQGITQAQMMGDVIAGGEGAGAAGINAAQVGQQQAIAQQAANSGITQAANSGFSQAEIEAMQRGQEMARVSSAAPPLEQTAGLNLNGTMLEKTPLNSPSSVTDEMLRSGDTNVQAHNLLNQNPVPQIQVPQPAPSVDSALQNTDKVIPQTQTPLYGSNISAPSGITSAPPAESGFMKGVSSAMDWADKNPFKTAIGSYIGAQKLGLFNQKKEQVGEDPYKGGILQNYKMSPDFKGRFAIPKTINTHLRYITWLKVGSLLIDKVEIYLAN
jgi:hypothetical protein